MQNELHLLYANKPQGQSFTVAGVDTVFNFCTFTFGHKVTMARPGKGVVLTCKL
jgi:hypothetical protein